MEIATLLQLRAYREEIFPGRREVARRVRDASLLEVAGPIGHDDVRRAGRHAKPLTVHLGRRVHPGFVEATLGLAHPVGHVADVGGEAVRLTPVEYKLLYQLARNAGRVMPYQALLDRIWGEEYGATTDHLKVFASRLRSKIERADGPRFIETERGIGYRMVRPPGNAQA